MRYYLSPPSSSGEYEIIAHKHVITLVGVGVEKISVGVYASKKSALLTAKHNNIELIEFGEYYADKP